MLPLHVTLSYYKRKEIQSAMIEHCRGKEVAVKFADHFGKRPDMMIYPSDVLSFAQKKATSFHISEESWSNPLQLKPGMRLQEQNEIRIGWDLILDVDFPVWEITKLITQELIAILQKEGIPKEAITCKFSGNKGFHIGVPYEAFPETVLDENDVELLTSDLFPDVVRKLVEYLVEQIDGPQNNYALSARIMKLLTDEQKTDLVVTADARTGKTVSKQVDGDEYVCPSCQFTTRSKEEYVVCEKCGAFMKRFSTNTSQPTIRKVDLAIDTMLVSSRHMYRLVYSLHEKSGLASIPVDIDSIDSFERSLANPTAVQPTIPFLSRSVPQDCARPLLQKAMEYAAKHAEKPKSFKEVEWAGDAAPEETFPPPIQKMLRPLRDGKKRALFVLTNFLRSVGWSYEMIEARLIEWNKEHPEPMREGDIARHLRYHEQKKQLVLPPNFDNDMYYRDLGVLDHDELSKRVKNPVQYVRLKLKQNTNMTNQKYRSVYFATGLPQKILLGEKTATWGVNENIPRKSNTKNVKVDDLLSLRDSADQEFAKAKITKVKETTFGELTPEDKQGHEPFDSDEEMYKTFSGYYDIQVGPDTKLQIIWFSLL